MYGSIIVGSIEEIGMLERLASLKKELRPSAGLLIHTRDSRGRTIIVAGRRVSKPKYAFLAKLGVLVQDCWSIPFGELEACDRSDFRACAMRETAEEVLPYDAHSRECSLIDCFNKWVGKEFSLVSAVAASREWRGSPLFRAFSLVATGADSRAYAVSLPAVPANAPSRDGDGEFVDGTLAWYELEWLRKQPNLFFGLRRLFHFFEGELRNEQPSNEKWRSI